MKFLNIVVIAVLGMAPVVRAGNPGGSQGFSGFVKQVFAAMGIFGAAAGVSYAGYSAYKHLAGGDGGVVGQNVAAQGVESSTDDVTQLQQQFEELTLQIQNGRQQNSSQVVAPPGLQNGSGDKLEKDLELALIQLAEAKSSLVALEKEKAAKNKSGFLWSLYNWFAQKRKRQGVANQY